MIYCETFNKECIEVRPLDDVTTSQYVQLIKHGSEPKFAVGVYDGEKDWVWEFDMSCPSDYERVKLTIYDAIFVCDTMFELSDALNEVFINEYEDILIEDECDCCGCCGGCEFSH